MGTQLLLDGRSISGEEDLHDRIDGAARAVGFGGYGRNLDALWDVLTAILERPVEARLINAAQARNSVGPRFDRIVRVFEDAHRELGADFKFEIEE